MRAPHQPLPCPYVYLGSTPTTVFCLDLAPAGEGNEVMELVSFPSHSQGDDVSSLCSNQHGGPSNTNDNWSNTPWDLTGQVTKSSEHPYASGGFGDIYRGNLNIQGRLINVRRRIFPSGKLNNC